MDLPLRINFLFSFFDTFALCDCYLLRERLQSFALTLTRKAPISVFYNRFLAYLLSRNDQLLLWTSPVIDLKRINQDAFEQQSRI